MPDDTPHLQRRVTLVIAISRDRSDTASHLMKIETRTEHVEQSALIAWARVTESMQTDPVRRTALRWLHAIPNGFHRGFAARRKAKAEGVKSGVLDLCVPAPELRGGVRRSGTYHGLYIEMKRKGEKLRPTQAEFMDFLNAVHYRAVLCYTWRAAARIIVEHLDLKQYHPIPTECEDDRLAVHNIVTEAIRLNDLDNPPKPKVEKPKRKSRPRTTASARNAKKKKASPK